jgi:hypothetical protein
VSIGTRPSLFVMAACIEPTDPWVLTSTSGAVRLGPLRLMSLRHPRSIPDAAALLDVTDLGTTAVSVSNVYTDVEPSPLRVRSEVVLLVPWSLLPTIAELEARTHTAPYEYDRGFAPEDWLPAWHRFITIDESSPQGMPPTTVQRPGDPLGAPCMRTRQYVLGTVRRHRGVGSRGSDPDKSTLRVHAESDVGPAPRGSVPLVGPGGHPVDHVGWAGQTLHASR